MSWIEEESLVTWKTNLCTLYTLLPCAGGYKAPLYLDVNSTAQGFSVEDTMTYDSYFNISELKLSITSPYIISDAPKYDIIWTENSDVIDSFISEIRK